MLLETSINLGNILLSFSDAIDLANQSIAHLGRQLAHAAGLPRDETRKMFLGAILHDVGALTPEDKTRLQHFEEKNIEAHCIRGAALFASCPLLIAYSL